MDVRTIDLKLHGMTCSSCVATIEGALNDLPGVSASVNFATETAHVIAPETITIPHVINAVTNTGYRAELLSASNNQLLETPRIGWRLILAVIFAIPTLIISMFV